MIDKLIDVYVVLLEEGADTIRATQAVDLGNGLARLLPTPWYDAEDEVWEFKPDTVIKYKDANDYKGNPILLAYEQA